MTSPEGSPDVVAAGVEELLAQAKRLGLVWTLLPGTVSNASSASGLWPASNTWVVQDNDTDPTRAMSLIGPLGGGTRVMVVHVPPQGNYIVGLVGATEPTLRGSDTWVDYGTADTVWTSTGTQPSIGDGTVTARYALLNGANSKTVAFRIRVAPGSTTTFGTGTYQFLLPFPIASGGGTGEQIGSALFRDNSGAAQYGGFTAWLQTGSTILSVSNSAAAAWTSSVPVVWADGDRAFVSGVYERE